MAKKRTRKTKKRKGGLRGMGSLKSSDKVSRALGLVTEVISANLAYEGINFLNKQAFMAPDATSTSKINVKQAAVDGGLLLAAGAGAVLIKNDLASSALRGVAVTASLSLNEDVVKPALGVSGVGAVKDYLNLYKKSKSMRGPGPEKKRVALAGPNPVRL